jgi:hypothetical protein
VQIFGTSKARERISAAAKQIPLAALPLSVVAIADWGTSVGFREGINALFDVQVILFTLFVLRTPFHLSVLDQAPASLAQAIVCITC